MFVNGTAVAWKRSPYQTNKEAASKSASDASFTLGCKKDGSLNLRGISAFLLWDQIGHTGEERATTVGPSGDG